MKKIILSTLFAIALFPNINFGCDCIPSTSFCEDLTNYNGDFLPDLIFRGKIIRGSSTEKEIKVNQLIFGTTNKKSITIKNMWDCDLFFHELEDDEEYIIALMENSGELIPFLCAVYFLKIENEVVKGKIAPGIESIKYKDLGDLEGCGNAFASLDFEKSISVFPNPTEGEVNVKNTGTNTIFENLEVTVFDILGKEITSFTKPEGILPDEFWALNIQNLSAGVYIFKLSGINQESYIRIVKQ